MGVHHSDFALGRMIRVWMECIERETYWVPDFIVTTIFDNEDAPSWLINCDLAERENRIEGQDKPELRIKGTEGRIEYLALKRENARKNGKMGGRPKSVTSRNQRRLKKEPTSVTAETPPAPALPPAPAQIKEEPPTPKGDEIEIPVSLRTDVFLSTWSEWQTYRKEIKKAMKPTTMRKQLHKFEKWGPEKSIEAMNEAIEKGWTGFFEPTPIGLNGKSHQQLSEPTGQLRPGETPEQTRQRLQAQTKDPPPRPKRNL